MGAASRSTTTSRQPRQYRARQPRQYRARQPRQYRARQTNPISNTITRRQQCREQCREPQRENDGRLPDGSNASAVIATIATLEKCASLL